MVIIGYFVTYLLGFSIVLAVNPKVRWSFCLPIAYLLGIGFQSLLMFYMALLRIKLTLVSVFALTLVVSSLILSLVTIFKKKSLLVYIREIILDLKRLWWCFWKRTNILEKLLVTIIGVSFIYLFLVSLYWPVFGWDSVALYDFRARVFAITGSMEEAIKRGYFFAYPLMTSFMHTWVYLLGFNYPKFNYALIYISFLLIFYYFLRQRGSRFISLCFTIFLMFSPSLFSQATFDYTNLPYTVYFSLGIIFLYIFLERENCGSLVLSSLFTALSTWVRSTDPFWIVVVLSVFIFSVTRKRWQPFFIFLAFFFPVQQSWSIFVSNYTSSVSTPVLIENSLLVLVKQGFNMDRWIEIFSFVSKSTNNVLSNYLFLYLFSFIFPIVYFLKRGILKISFFNLIVFSCFIVVLVGSYVFSYLFEGWYLIGESLSRMIFVLIPIVVYGLFLNIT